MRHCGQPAPAPPLHPITLHPALLLRVSRSVIPNSPSCTAARQPLSVGFPRKSTGMSCRFLLQAIFPSQGANPSLTHLPHWQTDSSPLSQPASDRFWIPRRCEITPFVLLCLADFTQHNLFKDHPWCCRSRVFFFFKAECYSILSRDEFFTHLLTDTLVLPISWLLRNCCGEYRSVAVSLRC